MRRIIQICMGSLMLGLLWGCSVMSPQVREEALPPIGFPELIENVEKYKGDTVILGGYVISVENKTDHSRILAVQSPLGMGERPKTKDHSQGRLVLVYPGFIDPEVYTKDRKITVGGKIAGSSATQQQPPYPFLQIDAEEIHLWPVPSPSPDPYRYDDDYPYYYPWWRYPHRYHRHWYH